MDEDLTRLEAVMKERAAEVSSFQVAPAAMLARARRRIVRNAVSTVLAVGLIVAGASAGLAGLGALRGPSGQTPGGTHTSTPAPSVRACTASDLRANANLQGAAGSLLGSIDVTNVGATSCTLRGRPTVTLLSAGGQVLSVAVRDVIPQWRADRSPTPNGWPVVHLRSGATASIRIRWNNQCPQLQHPARWEVGLPNGGGTLDVLGADTTSPPPCLGPAETSTLEVGPFEPGTGA